MAAGQEREGQDKQSDWNSQRANDFCAALLAMAGHDLRQPLQILAGVHGWLDRRLTGESEREYLRRGGLAITRLTHQIDDLIDVLRLYERASSIELVPVQLAPAFAELLRDNIEPALRRGVELRVCRTSGSVMSEHTLLAAILRNLVQNAVKYTLPGRRVLVGCRRRGTEMSIEVHDCGIGIPVAEVSRVFEAFHRVDSARSEGLGLGLFVVKKVAELLGHSIDVRSQIGRGSCFTVRAGAAVDVGLRRGRPS